MRPQEAALLAFRKVPFHHQPMTYSAVPGDRFLEAYNERSCFLSWDSQDVPTRTQRKFLHKQPISFFVGENRARGRQLEAVKKSTQKPRESPPKRYFKSQRIFQHTRQIHENLENSRMRQKPETDGDNANSLLRQSNPRSSMCCLHCCYQPEG